LIEYNAYPIGIDICPWAESELKDIIKNINKNKYECYTADASNKNVMNNIISKHKNIYGIVNNAGALGCDDYNVMINSHVKSAYTTIELCKKNLLSNGSIVNIGSIETRMSAPNIEPYVAAKGALWGLTIAYSISLADKNIRVNMVSPGNVNTLRNRKQYKQRPRLSSGFRKRTPLKRFVEPGEVADAIIYLLSGYSSAITGQDILVDCGYTRALWDTWANN
jgi:NAD(P)-dependent dehydrogenase (short-subunit alcohol dehydrogenase family)